MFKKIIAWILVVVFLSGVLFFSGYIVGSRRARIKLDEENQRRSIEFRDGIGEVGYQISGAIDISPRIRREHQLSRQLLSGIRTEITQGLREIDMAGGQVQRIIIYSTILERILIQIGEAERRLDSREYSNPGSSQYYYRNYSVYKRE